MSGGWTKPGRFSNRQRGPRIEDLVPLQKFDHGEIYRYRPVGPRYTYAEHWIEIKKREGGVARVPKICLAYNHDTGEFDKGDCPYCNKLGSTPKVAALQNVIDRKRQRNRPEHRMRPLESEMRQVRGLDGKPVRYKDKTSETWTPVVPVKIGSSVGQAIENMAALNTKTNRATGQTLAFGPEHPQFGFDLTIKYDKNAAAANAYFTQKEGNTPLRPEEMNYLLYKLDVIEPEPEHVAEKEAESMLTRLASSEGEGGGAQRGGGGGGGRQSARDYDLDLDAVDDSGGADDGYGGGGGTDDGYGGYGGGGDDGYGPDDGYGDGGYDAPAQRQPQRQPARSTPQQQRRPASNDGGYGAAQTGRTNSQRPNSGGYPSRAAPQQQRRPAQGQGRPQQGRQRYDDGMDGY